MKKINKCIFLLSLSVIVFSFGTTLLSAQVKSDEKRNVEHPPKLVVFDDSKSYSLQNSSTLLTEELTPSPEISFSIIKQEQDNLGFTHQKLQQYFNGIKVEFGTVTLHSANGTVKAMSSEFYPIQELNTIPGINRTIDLEISDDDGATWTSIWNQSGNKGNSWLSANVDLSAYVGGGVQLRFNRVTGSTWQADIAIDNISVSGVNAFNGGITDGVNTLIITDPSNSGAELSIHPNPIKEAILNVEVLGATATDYVIYNMIGQVVRQGTFSARVDVSLLEAGMYVIQVTAGDEKFVERFIKE